MPSGGYTLLPTHPHPSPTPPRGTIPSMLRLILRLINTCFAALSFLVLLFAAYMHFRPINQDPPDPPPSADFSIEYFFDSTTSTNSTRPRSWYVTSIGALGGYSLLTSALGLSGTNNFNRRHLLMYIFLTLALLIAEGGALVVACTENDVFRHLPADPSNWWPKTKDFVSANASPLKITAFVLMGVQLVAIAAASWLHSMYEAAYYAWLDEVEEYDGIVRRQLGRAVAASYADDAPENSPWVRRLATKYHVDQSQWRANETAARTTALLADDQLAPSGGNIEALEP